MPPSAPMQERSGWRTITAGALLAGAGVFLGAFGAHGLRDRLTTDQLAVWETGVRYHLYHALGMLVVGALRRRSPAPALRVSAALFAIGIVLFSGSLYALAVSGEPWMGAITPFGGVAFLSGWAVLAIGAWRS